MSRSSRQRFTILEHNHPFLHWDLLIQQGDVLATWRLLQRPGKGTWIPAEKLPDHRLLYLDYEGPVSNHRGTVSRFSTGQISELSAGSDSNMRSFQLFDSMMGNTAVCRTSLNGQPEWHFA